MAMARRSTGPNPRIGLWGYHGSANLGNEATVRAAREGLARSFPDATFVGFAINPRASATLHRFPAFPLKRGTGAAWVIPDTTERAGEGAVAGSRERLKQLLEKMPAVDRFVRPAAAFLLEAGFLFRAWQALRDVDLMVVTGMGPLCDAWGGPSNFPYTLLKWSLLCRLRGIPWIVLSSGAGPLSAKSSRLFLRTSLRLASYASVRDEGSKRLLASVTNLNDIPVAPDLVWGMEPGEEGRRERRADAPGRTVGLIGLPYRKTGWWENPDEIVYGTYLTVMAEFASILLTSGYRVRLVPTQTRMDPVFIEDLRERLLGQVPGECLERIVLEPVTGWHDVFRQLGDCNAVVTTRLHGAIFAGLLEKPILAISYHPKITFLMESLGLEDWCVPVERVNAKLLWERLQLLVSRSAAVGMTLQDRKRLFRSRLENQYRRLSSLVKNGGGN